MKIDLMLRSLKFWWQRRTKGWDDSDLWSLDWTIAKFIVPRLKRWLETGIMGHPHTMTHDEWLVCLRKMLRAFELVVDQFEPMASIEEDRKESKEIEEGLSLFSEWYLQLWD